MSALHRPARWAYLSGGDGMLPATLGAWTLGVADENANGEDERATHDHLQHRQTEERVHVALAHPGDETEFGDHDRDGAMAVAMWNCGIR